LKSKLGSVIEKRAKKELKKLGYWDRQEAKEQAEHEEMECLIINKDEKNGWEGGLVESI